MNGMYWVVYGFIMMYILVMFFMLFVKIFDCILGFIFKNIWLLNFIVFIVEYILNLYVIVMC